MITPAALREIHELQTQATQILNQRTVSRADGKRADLLIAKIASIKQTGYSSDEVRQHLANQIGREIGVKPAEFSTATPEQRMHEQIFRGFLSGKPDAELEQELRTSTTALAGQQTPVFSSGTAGGVLVPISFSQKVAEGRAAIDPLLDETVVTLIQEPTFTLPPLSIPGWDLSTITAVKVGEAVQHAADIVPAINSDILNKYTYRCTLAGTIEWETDERAYGDAQAALGRAFGVAFGRGIGVDLVNGDGSTGPQGVLTGAANSGVTTAAAGVFALADFTNIYFSVNKIYREAPKAAWLMADATYKAVLNAKDSSGFPFFPLVNDELRILGKPVYVCPSMPSAAGSKGIVFGDLGAYYVHSSSLYIRRRMQYPGLVEFGKVAWTGLQMVDAIVDDPTSGTLPPIVFATLHI
ncbi:MAG TPA: phage major capsid protein [Candidatus Angelobacter sp.]|jgi:HK97 family phage major capsid protein